MAGIARIKVWVPDYFNAPQDNTRFTFEVEEDKTIFSMLMDISNFLHDNFPNLMDKGKRHIRATACGASNGASILNIRKCDDLLVRDITPNQMFPIISDVARTVIVLCKLQ